MLRFYPYRLIIVGVVFVLISSQAKAFSGTEAASFLEIPVGARPAALGAAYTALANDGHAPVWNPGGLASIQTPELTAMHLDYLESIHYEFASYVHPLSARQALGASIQYLSPGSIDSTNASGNSIGDFSGHYAAYTLAYGHRIGERLGLGVSGKVIDAKIADTSARAFAGDIGLLIPIEKRFQVGAVISNIGSDLKFLDQSDPLPLTGKLGVSVTPHRDIRLSVEGALRRNETASGHFGVEWSPIRMVAMRTGYRTDTLRELSALAGFSTGIGVHLGGLSLDYAWVPLGDLGNTQYFSLRFRFGSSDQATPNLQQSAKAQDFMPL